MNTSEVLNRAADAMQARGWCRVGGMDIGNGPLCAMGGIAVTIDAGSVQIFDRPARLVYDYAEVERHPAYVALKGYLGLAEIEWVYDWNDAQPSAAPVIEAFRAVALIEASRENAAVEAARR